MSIPKHIREHAILGIPTNAGASFATKPKTIGVIGDSISTAGVFNRYTVATQPATWLSVFGSRSETIAAGTGTFDFRISDNKLRWTAPSDTAGPWTTIVAGYNKLESGVAGKEVIVGIKMDQLPVSDTSYNVTLSDNSTLAYSEDGYWYQALKLTGFAYDPVTMLGIPSDSSAHVLARMSQLWSIDSYCDAITTMPDIVICMVGTNDIFAYSSTAASVITNINGIVAAIKARGSTPLLMTITARGSMSGADFAKVQEVNRHILGLGVSDKSVIVVDAFAATVDPAVSTGAPITGYTTDGIHLSNIGASILGKAIAAKLNAINGGIKGLPRSRFGGDATNMVTNTIFTGTSGGKGTGVTGNVPNLWSVNRLGTSLAQVGSIVPVTNEMPWTQLVCSGATANDTSQFYMTTAINVGASLNAGDFAFADCEFDVSGATGLQKIEAYIFCFNGSVGKTILAGRVAGTGNLQDAAFSGVMRTPIRKVYGDTINYNIFMRAVFSAGGGATLKWRCPGIFKA